MRLIDGGKAARLNEHVEKLVQQHLNFGELLLDVHGTRGEILLTNGMVGKAVNKDLEGILKLLENRQVLSIGIYGMGGIGKTTFAKYIHNRLLQKSQGRVFWITVSHEFTIKSLQDNIARCICVDLSDENEEAIRAGRLNRVLSHMKNSVLILDDVWEKIDMTKVGCTFSLEGCRLIITTRSLEVCRRIGCKKLIPLVKLGKDEAWKLFNETLENTTELGPQVEEIAKSMAEVCDGLPLGIITVAGSMKGETTIYTWKNALVDLKDCVAGRQNDIGDVDEVFRVLKYSFDRLKRNDECQSNELNMIQHCFMYCSLYPEDSAIVRDDLVRKFISEGLMDKRKSRRAQVEQGLSILDKLVNLCLLESCVNWKRLESVKMHDLVRSMALMICKGKYMVRAGEWSLEEIPYNEEDWTKDLEKVSFMSCGIGSIKEGLSPDCPKLSTLLLTRTFELKVIPESFFSKMQGLCTLNLSYNTMLRMLPTSVSELTSLKALLLENCGELEMVPYLGKLKALRELNLSGTAIKEAPQGLEELINLRFLSMNAYGLKMFPRGVLLKLRHLQHLNLPLHIQVEELKGLKQLENFCGGVKNVSDFNWYVTTRGSHATCCYRIRVNYSRKACGFQIEKGDLGGKKNELELCGCNLKDEKVFGQGIAYLTIVECEGPSKCFVDDLPQRFNNPISLRELSIWSCGEIESILRSDGEGSNTLEVIHLDSLDDLQRIVMEIGASIAPTQPAMFPSLQELRIHNCNKMRKSGFAVSGLPNLESISIWSCEEIEELFEEDEESAASMVATLPKLKELSLKRLPRLRKVGLHIQEIPNLESISISDCGGIEEIFEEDEGRATSMVATLPKLKRLDLWRLPKLKKVGLHIQEILNLELISIQYCGEIEEIFEEDEGIGASILTTLALPKLRALFLENLPRLKSVSKATIMSNSIETIIITKCPSLKKELPLHFDDPIPPPSLRGICVEREWWESLEPSLPRLLQDFLTFQELPSTTPFQISRLKKLPMFATAFW